MKNTFYSKVYEVVSKIPKGKVSTYKDIAKMAGNEKAFRAVGTAMSLNSDKDRVPCHRVVGSTGSMNGYSYGGVSQKESLLKKEGVKFKANKVDLKVSRWSSI